MIYKILDNPTTATVIQLQEEKRFQDKNKEQLRSQYVSMLFLETNEVVF